MRYQTEQSVRLWASYFLKGIASLKETGIQTQKEIGSIMIGYLSLALYLEVPVYVF